MAPRLIVSAMALGMLSAPGEAWVAAVGVAPLAGGLAGEAIGAPLVRTGGCANLAADASAEASSAASDKYAAERALDGDPATWWASADGAALPQRLTLRFPDARSFDTVTVIPADMARLYSWISRLTVEAGGESTSAELPAAFTVAVVRLGRPVTAQEVAVIVEAVHEANHYVGLAEVMVFNDPERQVRSVADWRREWLEADRTPRGRREHPCVYMTRADVARARRAVKEEDWARDYLAGLVIEAEPWLARSDEEIAALVPGKGACFAYGLTGCPICGSSWGTWGGARCSFEKPGQVTCAKGHVLPDEEHPDPGTGYKAPDGRIHYMVGSYNAWAVETLAYRAARPLALAYTLTGDERYAAKAAVILDALADVYPSCTAGSWDYPSDPPSGRLNRPWYQVARVLVDYVDWYDQIHDSRSLDGPSVRKGLTRRENIERNLLMDGAEYCYGCSLDRGKMGLALHNGCADYVRGALAVGCCLGIPVYVRWAVDGPFGIRSLVANNVDRDGRYFETSAMYADHSRSLYLTFAVPLLNWRSEEHPRGVDVYADAQFARFYEAPAAAIACAGHTPRYGDSGPDFVRLSPEVPALVSSDFRFMLAAARAPASRYLLSLARGMLGGRLREYYLRYGDVPGMLFRHPLPDDEADLPPTPSHLHELGCRTALFGQKGLVVLRARGAGDPEALLLRYGPSLNHGHYDDLGFSYYALGYDATYELGYGLGSTHTQVGWAKQTAAHSAVVVDEQRQGLGPGSGGSLYAVADTPDLQVVEADSPLSYAAQGVTVYRRIVALVGSPPDCYALDLFRVAGGSQHDYFFHALGQEIEAEGAEWGPVEPGSLAGAEVRWGDAVGNDGDLKGYANKPYWVAPPGNGYGFLVDVRRARPTGAWQATWPLPDGRGRLTMTPATNSGAALAAEAITAWGPGILPQYPRARCVVLRRRAERGPLASTFACAYEPWAERRREALVTAGEVWRGAVETPGELIYLADIGVALWKSPGPEAVAEVELPAVAAGSYALEIEHYRSPSYGALSVSLDGRELGEIDGRGEKAEPAQAAAGLGPVELGAGAHRLRLRVSRPGPDGNHWFGVQNVALSRESTGGPRMRRVQALTPTPEGAGDAWPVAVRVELADGCDDYVATTAPEQTGTVAGSEDGQGGFSWSGLAWWRAAEGRPLRAFVMGGWLRAPGIELGLQPAFWAARVTEVDYERGLAFVDGELPADGRLDGALALFSNPAYSRNTAYVLAGVGRADGRTVLHLGGAPTLGVLGVEDVEPGERRFWSLIPHEYLRALGRASRFLEGKRLDAGGEKLAAVESAEHGSPCTVTVDDASRLRAGQRLYVRDVQEGDRVYVAGWAEVEAGVGGEVGLVGGNTDVVVKLGAREGRVPWRPK